jgi:anti-anti-sigma factor
VQAHLNGLELQVKRYPHVRVLAARGSLSGEHADRLCCEVREQLVLVPRLLVLEMAGVAAVDSAGVRALLHAARLAAEAGITLALVSEASTAVHAALEVNGLSELFEVRSCVEEAISELS